MRQGMGIYYYVLFETCAPDGSKFFGIHRTENPSYGSDGEAFTYIGNGPKLQAKAKQYGISRLVTNILALDPSYDNIKARLESILTPATLADPRCLNMPIPERNQKISESLSGQVKTKEHAQAIGESMLGNQNALGHIKTDEVKEQISEAKSNLKWCHNKVTGEELQLDIDEDLLSGFELGKLPKEFAKNFKRDRKHNMSDHDRAKLIKD